MQTEHLQSLVSCLLSVLPQGRSTSCLKVVYNFSLFRQGVTRTTAMGKQVRQNQEAFSGNGSLFGAKSYILFLLYLESMLIISG